MAASVRAVVDRCALGEASLAGSVVVVLDVLRATTTLTRALEAGVPRLKLFATIAEASQYASLHPGTLLAGEANCLKPAGFDLGNSPGQYRGGAFAGREVAMATTNGTRAMAACRSAGRLLAGAIINARAVAQVCANDGRDVLIVPAGTEGGFSFEDALGGGLIASHLAALGLVPEGDAVMGMLSMAAAPWPRSRELVLKTLACERLRQAGLEADIEECLAVDVSGAVGEVGPASLEVRRVAD